MLRWPMIGAFILGNMLAALGLWVAMKTEAGSAPIVLIWYSILLLLDAVFAQLYLLAQRSSR